MKLIRTGTVRPTIYLHFPRYSEWIGRIFPTYHMIEPIMDIGQRDATWFQVAMDIYNLIGLIVLLIAFLGWVARRESAKDSKIDLWLAAKQLRCHQNYYRKAV